MNGGLLIESAKTSVTRSSRLGLRATPEQETLLRRAAEAAHASLTNFILDAACQAAEHTLLDQRLFLVSGSRYRAVLEMLEQPAADGAGSPDRLARRPPWDRK